MTDLDHSRSVCTDHLAWIDYEGRKDDPGKAKGQEGNLQKSPVEPVYFVP